MKKLMLSTAMLAVSGLAAFAQDAGTVFQGAADPAAVRASELIGKRIYASEAAVDATEYEGVQQGWQDIGEVNDVILTRDGAAQAVLIDIGGFLGIGERQVAVSMTGLHFVSDSATAENLDDYFLVLNASRSVLEGAPAYVADEAAVETMPEAAATADAVQATDGATTPEADMAAEDATEGEAVMDEATGTDVVTDPAQDDTAATDPATREVISREGWIVAAPAAITTDRLTGADAYDSNDEKIGDVADLILDDQGQVTQAVIDVGGFLGIGSKPVALMLGQVDILQEDGGETLRVYVPMTKEQMEALPSHEG
ncbi:MAG: PRC-barrel domain-containing protein [Paracoccaceae bacterium]